MQANHAFPGRNAMKVIYIAGTSHSGSTLLDLMLNAHPAIISVGEIFKLNRQLKPRGDKGRYVPCSCGAPSLWQCPFWSRVNDHVEQSHGKSLVDFDVQGYGELDEAPAPNVAVFEAIAEVAGKKIVVDSSKMPRRLSHLMQLAWAEAEKHLVAGNHLRRQSSSELVLDDKWERGLSAAQKLAIDLGTLRSRRLLARTDHVSDG